MTVEDLPDLNPPDFGNVVDPARPILSFSWQADGPHRAARHRHPRAHIIHPVAGALWASTPEGTWLVPKGQAIWVAPRVFHEIFARGPVAARMLFVDEAYAARLPARCGTVSVSDLLVELIRRAMDHGNDYDVDGPAARLAAVLLDELATLELAPLLLPISADPRLTAVLDQLLADPGSTDDLATLARQAGASPRTLARLFRSELGMTFTEWRTRLRLVESIERLDRGQSVTRVAADLGYGTTSGFVYMFRRNLGVSPGSYRAGA